MPSAITHRRKIPTLPITILCWCGLGIVPISQVLAASTSIRSFACDAYTPGLPTDVTIQVTPDPATQAWAAQETPPAGWTVSEISDAGAYDSINAQVKWGPFFDNQSRTLSFKATPPGGETGEGTFVGNISLDGTNVTTTGTHALSPDETSPSITCPPDPSPISADEDCQATLPDLTNDADATDNCDSDVTITQDPPAETIVGIGDTLVTLTATDDAGNTDTCTVTITVIDTTSPVITCPPTPTPITANTQCQASVPDLIGSTSATDNCDTNITITQSPPSGTVIGIGNTLVTLTATDDAGNTDTCNVTLTVVDTTPPVITCPPAPPPISANATCQAPLPDLTGDASATDNCDTSVTITQNPQAGTMIGIGNTLVTLTATDDAGNTDTCNVTVTVVDTTPPVITCPSDPPPISADANCQALLPDLTTTTTATDNCDTDITIAQSPPAGTSIGTGNTLVTITATDDAGNTDTCTVTVTVVDTTPPVITCPPNPGPIAADANCQAVLPDLTVSTSATDNCDTNVAITQNPPAATTIGTGDTLVTLTATDDAGNTDTCTVTITVVDTTPPVITCPPNPAPIPADANCQAILPDLTASSSANDNCDTSVDITQSPPAGTTIGTGDTLVTLTATDDRNNTDTCTVTVTVVNNPPVIDQGEGPLTLDIDANTLCPNSNNQLHLSATDTDQDTTHLSWSVKTEPVTGTASITGSQTGENLTVCYEPSAGQMAPDSFVVEVTDLCGDTDEITINAMIEPLFHSADTDLDWWIRIAEMTAYATCWKSGCTWSVEPNPIPIEYLTRCGYLWRVSEAYHYDVALNPPDCWQPGLSGGQGARMLTEYTSFKAIQADPADTNASRFIEQDINTANQYRIHLEITPPSVTSVWAVEEVVPSGWNVLDINEGGVFETRNSKVKWGPFFDNQTRTLSYSLARTDDGQDEPNLTGVISVDGSNTHVAGAVASNEPSQPIPTEPILGWPCGIAVNQAMLGVCLAMGVLFLKKRHRH